MPTLPPELVGDAYTSTRAWDLLCELVDIDNRMAGQQGEAEGAEVVKDAFEEYGLRDTTIDEFEIPGWWRGSCSLTVERDRTYTFDEQYQTVALPGTPSGEVQAELVDVGYGRPEDFESSNLDGKIAMVSSETPEDYGRWIHRGEKYSFAVKNGATAFVFYNHVEGSLPPTGGVGNDEGPGDIPAVGVSREVGERLVRYCDSESVDATLTVDCRNDPAVSQNVEGVLGPDTDEEVLVVAHVDGHDISEAARDNGAGTALVTEIGRLLAQVEDRLETRIRFVAFGSEEVGLLGSYHWVETRPTENVKAVLNTDGTGYSRDLRVYTHRFDEIGDVFEDVADEFSIPISTRERIRPHSDHWPFLQEGVPSVQIRSKSDSSGRGWVHTHADTLDKIDLRDLRELAVPISAATIKVAQTDREIPHKSVSEVRDAVVEDGHDVGKRNTDSWPFDE